MADKEDVKYSEDSVQQVVDSLFDEVKSIKNELKETKSQLDEKKIADIFRSISDEKDSQKTLIETQDRSYNSVVSSVKGLYEKAGVEFDPNADETEIINHYAAFANIEASRSEKEKRDFNFKNVEDLTIQQIKRSLEKFSGKKSSDKDDSNSKKSDSKKHGKMSLASEGGDVELDEEVNDIEKEIKSLDKLAETNREAAEGRRMVLLANLQILRNKMVKEKEKSKSFFSR